MPHSPDNSPASPLPRANPVSAPTSPLPAHAPAFTRRLNTFFNRLFTLLFVLALAIPLLGTFFHWDPTPLAEKRALAPFPTTPQTYRDFTRYSTRALDWFTDHFGFRNTLIHATNSLRFRTVGMAHTGKVIVGKDNWLFVRRSGENGPADFSFNVERGLTPFTPEDLERWRLLFEKRHAYLSARHIPCLVVIPPDKQAVYPEFLPAGLSAAGPMRLDQLLAHLREKKSPVRVLDLRPVLLAAKPTGTLYWKTDTHWNYDGAWFGYDAIMRELNVLLPNRGLAAYPAAAFPQKHLGLQGGDLSNLLGIGDILKEPWPTFQNAIHYTYKELPPTGNATEPTLDATLDPPPPGIPTPMPRLLMFRDSFATPLFPMLAQHFSHSHYIWNDALDPAAIATQQPDVVISEFVERKLYWKPPTDPPEITNTPIPQ